MTRVAPVKLKNTSRALWFDPADIQLAQGDAVVVSTARGLELGYMAEDICEVDQESVNKLKTPLKPVVRRASEEDLEQAKRMEELSKEALFVFKELVEESGENMRPVTVDYLLDGDRAVFYFEAEERVDFRDLVRRLAGRLHIRVDMRQIGVRDEARMIGGLGHCGQELCCKRLGGELCPVSIRMAKEQDLSLNPQKISGVCGRLMCCLRYEFDAYKDFKQRAPKKNASIETPEGPAKVADLDVLREVVSLKNEEGKIVKVPLASFEEPESGSRPHLVEEEAWQEAKDALEDRLNIRTAALVSTQELKADDRLAKPGAVHHRHHEDGDYDEKDYHNTADGPKLRRRRKTTALTWQGVAEKLEEAQKTKNSSKKKAKSASSGSAQKGKKRRTVQTQVSASSGSNKNKKKQKPSTAARPGQKSSALRQHSDPSSSQASSTNEKGGKSPNANKNYHIRRRVRTKWNESDS